MRKLADAKLDVDFRRAANKHQGMAKPSLDALLTEGSLAGRAGDFDHAIACFRAALKQAPQHPGVMLYLSKAYGLSFQYGEARQWLQKALRLAPQNERLLAMAADNYLEWDRPEGALPLLRQWAERHSRSLDAWLKLARVLERANQVEAATEAAERASALSGAHPELLWLQGRLAQRAGRFTAAREQFEKALGQKPGAELAAEIGYGLAAVCDAEGDYEAAWLAASQAKLQQRAEAERLCEPVETWRTEVEQLSAVKRLMEARDPFAVPTPVTVLCGYPRSGTTLLGQMVAGHPQVTYVDETLAATRVLRQGENLTDPSRADWFLHTNPQQRNGLRREYQRCLEAHLERRISWSEPGVVDKNPAFTRFVPALATVLPGLKVVFPLRDPRDIAISCYLRPFPVNAFTAHFNRLETLVAHLRANWRVWRAISGQLPLALLEIRYEDLLATPSTRCQAACEFMGIDPGLLPADHRVSATARFIHSPTYAEVLEPLHRRAVGRWQAYARHLGSELEPLNDLAREQGYN